jgi:hypothetical protein
MSYIVVEDLDGVVRGSASIKPGEDAEEAFFDICERNNLYAKDHTFEIEE